MKILAPYYALYALGVVSSLHLNPSAPKAGYSYPVGRVARGR